MRRQKGFSLLELVVVLAMFAIVALIGVKVIQATLQTDRRFQAIDDEAGELAVGLALLRQDLKAAVGLPFYAPGGRAEPALDAPARVAQFSLSIGGMGLDGTVPSGQGRVTWRLDQATGQVLRQLWPVLSPADRQVAGAEMPVFSGIRSLELQGFIADTGWTVGFPKPNIGALTLPDALRVRLVHDRLDTLETLVVLQ